MVGTGLSRVKQGVGVPGGSPVRGDASGCCGWGRETKRGSDYRLLRQKPASRRESSQTYWGVMGFGVWREGTAQACRRDQNWDIILGCRASCYKQVRRKFKTVALGTGLGEWVR